MDMMTLMYIITLTRKSEKHEQHLFECADKVVSCSNKNKQNRQQIVFVMHSTTNHDMAALKTN